MPTVNTIPGTHKYPPPGSVISGVNDTQLDAALLSTLDGMTATLNSLSLTAPTTAMEALALKHNRWLLGTGSHAGVSLDVGGVGAIKGANPGAVINNVVRCMVASNTIISGVEFNGSDIVDSSMLVVQNGARAIVRNCVFARGDTSTTPLIQVDSGGKLIVEGCIFTGMGTTANYVITHPGAAANLYVSYCFNLTNSTTAALAANWIPLGVLT